MFLQIFIKHIARDLEQQQKVTCNLCYTIREKLSIGTYKAKLISGKGFSFWKLKYLKLDTLTEAPRVSLFCSSF